MYKKSGRGRYLSQNFLRSRKLVKSLVGRSSIGKNDIVYEIGPGKGIITEELARVARKVIAIEIDLALCQLLRNRFCNTSNIKLYNTDFLRFNIKHSNYKVFANIPFSIEGKIIRKLLDSKHPPQDTYLVMRKEVADRLVGKYKEGQFSVSYNPWFELSIFHYFKRADFIPKPKVRCVMLRAKLRGKPLIKQKDRSLYLDFVKCVFGGGGRLEQNLRKLFSKPQINKLAKECGISLNSKPTDLTFKQWLRMFDLLC